MLMQVDICQRRDAFRVYDVNDVCVTLTSMMGGGGNNVPLVITGGDGMKYVTNSNGSDIAPTIDSHYYLGAGNRGGNEREFVVMENELSESYRMSLCRELSGETGTSGLYERSLCNGGDNDEILER